MTPENEDTDVDMRDNMREGSERMEEAKKSRIEGQNKQGILGDMRTAVECRRAVRDMTQQEGSGASRQARKGVSGERTQLHT